MDNLFSNIQQNLSSLQNTSNSKDLLQRQKISQYKINELLEMSAEAIMCGPDCQKSKISEELKQKYLDAQTNLQTAPINLENTKKNYYVYTEGRPYYDNMLEEELKQKAEKISLLLSENFNNEVDDSETMNTYLNTALINSKYTKQLLEEYLDKNHNLKLQLKERHGDILTNDRKTFYETDAYDRLILWYRFFWYIYYIVVLMFMLALVFSLSKLSMISKMILSTIFIFYPYYINYITKWVYSQYKWLISKIPKNVYNDL